MTPTRGEFLYFSSVEKALFYVLIFASIGLMAYQIFARVKLWKQGKPIDWKPAGIKAFFEYIIAQRKVRTSRRKSGAPMHLLIFYGFLSLFIATTILAINTYGPFKFHKGNFYLAYEFTFDLLGLLFVVGVSWAIVRRFWFKPKNMAGEPSDAWVLALLLLLGISGYLSEAARIAANPQPWDKYSFVGSALASLLGDLSPIGYKTIWWFHTGWVMLFFATLPQMRIRHIVMAIASSYGHPQAQPWGELKPISLEEVEKTGKIGVELAADYSRWHLMSLDACMECGRCTDACPANRSGKILNPKQIVQDIRQAMVAGTNVAEAVSEESLWACTTCNACVEACPVLIRHVDLIVDARRWLVAEGRYAGTGATMLRQLGSTGHSWGAPQSSREDWMQGLDIPLCRDGGAFEYLLWVGCAGATDPAAVRTTKALSSLLKKAGVSFACLGNEETCTGDPARRVGDEFTFQEKATINVEAMKRYGVTKIVTACPHCMNTFKNEYHQFELEVEVVHHSQLLAQLVEEGRLKGYQPLKGSVTYHDPCYLARVNNESDAPRRVFGESTNLNAQNYPQSNSNRLAEPTNYGRKTLCCGAGGGRMWMEEPPENRPGNRRAEELVETGASTVAVGCPFCRIMLDASIKQVTETEIKLVDLSELLQEANHSEPVPS